MDKHIREIPVVKVFKTDDGRGYFFWCPFCNRFHTHGTDGLGHRLAHCTNHKAEFIFGEYILKEYTKKELREIGLPTDYYEKCKKK